MNLSQATVTDTATATMRRCEISVIKRKDESHAFIKDWVSGRGVEDYVLSATIEAIKPGGGCCC